MIDEKDQEKFLDKLAGLFRKKETETAGGQVSLAEFQDVQTKLNEAMGTIKNLSEIVTNKTKQFETQATDLMRLAEQSRVTMAEAICKSAINDGVPPAFVDNFRKVLASDVSERLLKFSEEKDGKKIEKEISLKEIIQDSFAKYPNKINLSDQTKTSLDSKSEVKERQMKDRKLELMEKEKMSEHEALKQIAREYPEEV